MMSLPEYDGKKPVWFSSLPEKNIKVADPVFKICIFGKIRIFQHNFSPRMELLYVNYMHSIYEIK